jgi:diaminopimelate epimerase
VIATDQSPDPAAPLRFLKGHGTENDFIIIPDPDGRLPLPAAQVAELCDRRAGLGADGVLRVVRADRHPESASAAEGGQAEWFMDYRNADGSIAEMCGNGARVFARYLLEAELIKAEDDGSAEFLIATRAGLRQVRVGTDELITIGMGRAGLPDSTGIEAATADGPRPARKVDMGNPHAVVFVADLAEAGPLLAPPAVTPAGAFPEGANVEYVVDRGPGHVAMRVHERGSGETRSCGTGACAVMVAAARRDGTDPARTGHAATYTVDVPGGRLTVTEHPTGEVDLTGPARLVASGELCPSRGREARGL